MASTLRESGDALQSSDKRTFLKETVDYCREDVRFAFNCKQTVFIACTSISVFCSGSRCTIIAVMLYVSCSMAIRVSFIACRSTIMSSISRERRNDHDRRVSEAVVL